MIDIDRSELCPFGCRCQEAADEIERLRFEKQDAAETMMAEIERLRAALRDFAFADVEWVRNRARRALEGK